MTDEPIDPPLYDLNTHSYNHNHNNTIQSAIIQLIYTIRDTIQSRYTSSPSTTQQHINDLYQLNQSFEQHSNSLQQLHTQLTDILKSYQSIHSNITYIPCTNIPLINYTYNTMKSMLSYMPLGNQLTRLAEQSIYKLQSVVLPVSHYILHQHTTIHSNSNNNNMKLAHVMGERSTSTSSTVSNSTTTDKSIHTRRESIIAASQSDDTIQHEFTTDELNQIIQQCETLYESIQLYDTNKSHTQYNIRQ